MIITDLRCEQQHNPIGLDVVRPVFSWVLESRRRGDRQTAYRIVVGRTDDPFRTGIDNIWDSGKVDSDRQSFIEFGGSPLRARQRCFWSVQVWDSEGNPSEWAPVSMLEMGLLDETDWTSGWWGSRGLWSGRSLLFRMSFMLAADIRYARAYVAGIGYHILHVNGRAMTDRVLDPAWTEYSRRILYTTYDITGRVVEGRNSCGVMLGNGWYGRSLLRAQIEVTYLDGRRQVVSDGDWVWQVSLSPVTDNDIYRGERYDARLEQDGWDTPDFMPRGHRWFPAHGDAGPGGMLRSQDVEPIQIVREIVPTLVSRTGPSAFIFDMGENISGWCRVAATGDAGSSVMIRHSEVLKGDGLGQENLRSAAACCEYVLRGSGVERYEPRFSYFGFRYVEIVCNGATLIVDQVRGCLVRTASRRVSEFSCESDLLNRIEAAVQRTEGNNLHGIPTDCPQRDERLGWLNDLSARTEAALYGYDLYRLYRKWFADIADAQDPVTGSIPDTAPFCWGSRTGDPVNCPVILAWQLYRFYGDASLLRTMYPVLRSWMGYLDSLAHESIIRETRYGDWCPPAEFCLAPGADPGPDGVGAVTFVGSYPANTPGALMSTAYFHGHAIAMARIASIVGFEGEARCYRRRASQISRAFNEKFYRPTTRDYGTGSQASNSTALAMCLVPARRRASVVRSIVRDVDRRGSLTTGNQATKHLLETLSAEGRFDEAFDLAVRTTYPSWGYMLTNGATTIWERWENLTGSGMNSHDHPMFGSIGAWIYRYVVGLRPDDEAPGWRRFHAAPPATSRLREARGTYWSIVGEISLHWRRTMERLEIGLRVPCNATAVLHIAAAFGPVHALRESGDLLYPTTGDPPAGIRFVRSPDPGGLGPMMLEVGGGIYSFELDFGVGTVDSERGSRSAAGEPLMP